MTNTTFLPLRNGEVTALTSIPLLPAESFRQDVLLAVLGGARISALFGHPLNGQLRLFVVLADEKRARLLAGSCDVERSFRSMARECPQARLFEREIAEEWGVVPEGHPCLEPVRFKRPRREAPSPFGDGEPRPGVRRFFQVAGVEVHEVAVGPVHAGIIEPGHFRFQCHGEDVLHLEIALGYQHRGVERAFVGGPTKRTMPLAETLAGDTTMGHAMAHAHVIESLGCSRIPQRAQALRGIALELERLANHVGDLGAIAGDIAYLPTASFCGRLRGDFLNMTALLCGSRFGRSFVRPGGVRHDVDGPLVAELQRSLEAASADVTNAVELLWESPSVMARLQGVGIVTADVCRELGLVGPPARACAVASDVRSAFPTGIYEHARVPIAKASSGDVFARAWVRWLEIQSSAAFVREQLAGLPGGTVLASVDTLQSESFVAVLVEGWRGEIAHVVLTDAGGRFATYKVVDPSFKNWMGLAMAMRGQQISDFPLCNKSFNLSYCGHDL